MASFSINAILGHSTQKQQETNDVDLRHTNCVDESSSQQQDQKGERIEGKIILLSNHKYDAKALPSP